jgi:hypothetical protein
VTEEDGKEIVALEAVRALQIAKAWQIAMLFAEEMAYQHEDVVREGGREIEAYALKKQIETALMIASQIGAMALMPLGTLKK